MRATAMFVCVLVAMAAASAAVAAPVFDDPKGLVEYAYVPYRTGDFPEDPFELYSPTLIELWQAMEERTPEGEVGAVDFDPLVNAQDYEVENLSVSEPAVSGGWAIVTATFTNLGEAQQMRFTLVRRAEGWKIDDIESLAGDYPWRLSELLAADPLLN